MGRIANKFRFEETRQSLYVAAPPPPLRAHVGAFCYDDNLILENENLGRMYCIDPEGQSPRAIQMKWLED